MAAVATYIENNYFRIFIDVISDSIFYSVCIALFVRLSLGELAYLID